MRRVQDAGGRRLVDLARLDPHQAVLDHVDPADAMRAGNRCQAANQLRERHRHAVDFRRHACLEFDLHVSGRVRTLGRRLGERIDFLGRLGPRILEHPAFDRAAPEVSIGAVRAVNGDRHGNAVRAGVRDLIGPRHPPDPSWCDDSNGWIERARRDVDPDLVVAFAGAAMGDGARSFQARDLDQLLRNQRPAERRRQRILVFVDRSRLERRQDVLDRELVAHVDEVSPRRPDRQRACPHIVPLFPLPEVERHRDHLGPVMLDQPRNRHRGIESTRICQNNPFHVVSPRA